MMKKIFLTYIGGALLLFPLSLHASIAALYGLEEEAAEPTKRPVSPPINKPLLRVHETDFLKIPIFSENKAKERALARYKYSRKAINKDK